MDNFTLCLSTEYVFGRSVEERVGELTASRGAKVALVCRGHGSAVRSGLWQRVLDSLEKHGIRTVALANDDGMRTVANTRLDALNKELELKGDAFGYQFFNKVDAKWDNDNKNATLTLVAKYDYNDTTLQKIIDQIKGNDQNEALDFALNGNYTKAGVVARIIHGQTYVAISLRVGRNL